MKELTPKNLLLNIVGQFTWSFSDQFFIETEIGNFIWFDPDYNGDNTIKPFNGTYKDWCKSVNIPFGRDKGKHLIKSYVGSDFTLIIKE